MKVYLLLRLIDNVAYITEGVFGSKDRAEKVMQRLTKQNNWTMKIEGEKVR
jgi:hypothetical protein